MTGRRIPEGILSLIKSSLDAATSHPGLVKASVYQTEGYLRGLQGLPWEMPAAAAPSSDDAAASFLYDVRSGEVALRGRVKKESADTLEAFRDGMSEGFPGCEGKPFAGAVVRLWVRWLEGLVAISTGRDALSFSHQTGRRVGELLREEYEEGLAGQLAAFLLDKRLHLGSVRPYLRMRGWLVGTIEHMSHSSDPSILERSEILNANLSSVILRALHNAGPSYAAQVVERLPSIIRDLDRAIRNLAATEPEASVYLRNNRSTIITKALHSGMLGYGDAVTKDLPKALKALNARIGALENSSPKTAKSLRTNKRTVVYRALTNGRLDALK